MSSYRLYLTGLSTKAAAIAAAFALVACSGTSTTSPTSAATTTQVSEDVAEATSSDIGTEVTDIGSAESDADAESATPFRVASVSLANSNQATAQSACTLGSTTGSTTYPASDPRDTIAFTRTWEFFSATGCESAYSAGATDTIQYTFQDTLSLNGKAEHWHGHRYADRGRWVTGDTTGLGTLLATTSTRFWNGTGTVTDALNFTHPKFTATYGWVASDTLHNMSFPHPRNGDLYPLGGIWTRWVNGNATFSGGTSGTATVARHIIVTFATDQSTGQGSVDATLQVYDVNTGTLVKTCTVDLSVGQIVPGSCQ